VAFHSLQTPEGEAKGTSQLVESLPRMHKALDLITTPSFKHICNPSTRQVETGGSKIQCHAGGGEGQGLTRGLSWLCTLPKTESWKIHHWIPVECGSGIGCPLVEAGVTAGQGSHTAAV